MKIKEYIRPLIFISILFALLGAIEYQLARIANSLERSVIPQIAPPANVDPHFLVPFDPARTIQPRPSNFIPTSNPPDTATP